MQLFALLVMGDGTTRNMYEVEQFSGINKLGNVASYWIYIGTEKKTVQHYQNCGIYTG
jgi:hypothetical protein